jgi:hypothetical protein
VGLNSSGGGIVLHLETRDPYLVGSNIVVKK